MLNYNNQINHATYSNLYRSYYPHRSRELVSPVCGIFFRGFGKFKQEKNKRSYFRGVYINFKKYIISAFNRTNTANPEPSAVARKVTKPSFARTRLDPRTRGSLKHARRHARPKALQKKVEEGAVIFNKRRKSKQRCIKVCKSIQKNTIIN